MDILINSDLEKTIEPERTTDLAQPTGQSVSSDDTRVKQASINHCFSVNSENDQINEIDKSSLPFTSNNSNLPESMRCEETPLRKPNHIKEFQNQACQTESRPKRRVNFRHLAVDQNVPSRSSLDNYSPRNLFTKVITKGRENRRRSNNERKLRQVAEEAGDVEGENNKMGKPMMAKEKKHVSLEAKRERKAAKTLAIVTGAFIACWLPFFILAVMMPIFHTWEFNPHVVGFFLWLGYFNSTLNPIIYTIFSPEFRQAFKKILCGKSAAQNHRPRHLQ